MQICVYVDIISQYEKDCSLTEAIRNDEPIQQGDNYPIEDHVEIRTQIKNSLKPLASKIRDYDKKLIKYSNVDMSPEYIERGLSSYLNFGFIPPEGLTDEEIDKYYKWSIRYSEHKDLHGSDKNRYRVELEGRTLDDLCKVGWRKFKSKLPKIQKKIKDFEIEKFGEQKTFITDPKPKDETTTNTTNNDSAKQESFKLKIKETNEKRCFTMKLMIREDFEDTYSNDTFAVLKDYLAKEFNPSRWDDLIYDFKEIPFDTGWFAEIIFTNTGTGQRIKFTAEYKDAYDGILYGTYNYGKESTFYSQKEYVDWLAEQVEWRLY